MIYEAVSSDQPIKQGDIFCSIPRVELSLSRMMVIDSGSLEPREVSWRDMIDEGQGSVSTAAVFPMKSVDAIVITQNCDAARGEHICLSEIGRFTDFLSQKTPPTTPGKWKDLIIRQSRMNLRFFYLPPDPSSGFADRMAADFRTILRIPRRELEDLRDLRKVRLNTVATEHFRETLAQFFRRYPYNEWYPLTKEEFAAYTAACPEAVQPYPWQVSDRTSS
jgi:hypothetical protein